jgi:hypothetical protein
MSKLTVRRFPQSEHGLSTVVDAGYGDGNPNINHD